MKMNKNWNLLGHEWAVDFLKNSFSNGRIHHAYLFTGPPGVGRRTLALRFAQTINCTQVTVLGQPCGECRSCLLIEKMQHPDISIIQAEVVGGNLRVDQVRELQHNLALTPYEAKFRIALILRFEEANQNAANALLKTLEEPSPQVIMLLTAQESEALLPTIVSRCELIRLRPLPISKITDKLHEGYGLPHKEAKLLAHISEGRPGYAIKLHQDTDLLDKRSSLLKDQEYLLYANRVERFSLAEGMSKDKENLEYVFWVWSSFWRDILLMTTNSTAPLTNIDYAEKINNLAAIIDPKDAVKMIKTLDRTRKLIHQNINTRLALETLFLDLPIL